MLRVLSEHHLSQQVAVLLPSSLTFSRPRKQCLRLSTRDIIHVELAGGGFEEGSRSKAPSPSSQLIPGEKASGLVVALPLESGFAS